MPWRGPDPTLEQEPDPGGQTGKRPPGPGGSREHEDVSKTGRQEKTGRHERETPEVRPETTDVRDVRVRELHCLYGISHIVEGAGGSLRRILQGTVELLAQAFPLKPPVGARIILGHREVRSAHYRPGAWSHSAEIRVHGESRGSIEITCPDPPPSGRCGFGEDERRLVQAVAERLGHIAERLEAERRLQEHEAELRERLTHLTRVSTLGEMASNIAHEINQPLTAIASYAQACRRLLRSPSTDRDEILEVLSRIGDQAVRAGNIVQRLRTLVRKRSTSKASCDINACVEEIQPLFSADARLQDCQLRVELEEDLPRVHADGVQIQQVILNLIRNGIDAMEDNPPDQKILEIKTFAPDGRTVQISVTDRGSGLPEETEDQLFEPFFTTKEGGMGLGLSVSRSIMESHGGRIWFSSDRAGGTSFHLSLPIVPETTHE